jgi:uncharacterized protein (AIM24 family)
MATFTIRDVEGMRQIQVDLVNETARARRGAMSNLRGNITVIPRLPGPLEFIRSIYSDEARIRPEYVGTGTAMLQPSLGGYHLMDVTEGEGWVLEPGIYWASEGSIKLGLFRDPMWTSFLLGDGLINWKTRIGGSGKLALNTPGPVEIVEIAGSTFRAQGRIILGHTVGLKFTTERVARFPRNIIAGQKRLRVLRGTGKVLVCFTPYWNEHMYKMMTGSSIEQSIFE